MPTDTSAISSAAHALAREWMEEVTRRRTMSTNDVTADILAHCAERLQTTIDQASALDEELSPAEFGELPHVGKSASQVRRWCQSNAIVCRRVGRDYRIRRGAALPAFQVHAA